MLYSKWDIDSVLATREKECLEKGRKLAKDIGEKIGHAIQEEIDYVVGQEIGKMRTLCSLVVQGLSVIQGCAIQTTS